MDQTELRQRAWRYRLQGKPLRRIPGFLDCLRELAPRCALPIKADIFRPDCTTLHVAGLTPVSGLPRSTKGRSTSA